MIWLADIWATVIKGRPRVMTEWGFPTTPYEIRNCGELDGNDSDHVQLEDDAIPVENSTESGCYQGESNE